MTNGLGTNQDYVPSLANRLLDDGTYTYAYDGSGTLLVRTLKSNPAIHTNYLWDHRQRLTRVLEWNGAQVTAEIYYTYDADGQLVKRTLYGSPPQHEYYVYSENPSPAGRGSGEDELAMSFASTGSATPVLEHRYLYGPVDQVLVDEVFNAAGQSTEVLWQLTDQQGTIRDIASGTGTLRKHIDYDSFGRVTGEQPYNGAAVDQLFYFTGQQRDNVTGDQLHGERWYRPSIGRWLSEDPIGFDAGDANLYRYVGNGVTYRTDPTGLVQAGNPLNNLFGKPNVPASTSALLGLPSFTTRPAAPIPSLITPLPAARPAPVLSRPTPTVDPILQQANDYFYRQTLNQSITNPSFARQLTGPAAPTAAQLFDAELNPHGPAVSVQTIVSPVYGDIFRTPSATLQTFGQTTNNPLAAGAAQFVRPLASIVGTIAGGFVDAALPASDPRHVVTYRDGTRGLFLGEGPTTGGLAGQIPFGHPILTRTSRVPGQLVLRTGDNTLTTVSTGGRGIWDLTPEARWTAVEQQLGKNLPANYPVIDKFESGIATSIKSLDLGAQTYLNPAAITRTGGGYVDKVAGFRGRDYARVDIRSSQITGKSLDLAVPPGATAAQKQALQDVVDYGRHKGVTVNIVEMH